MPLNRATSPAAAWRPARAGRWSATRSLASVTAGARARRAGSRAARRRERGSIAAAGFTDGFGRAGCQELQIGFSSAHASTVQGVLCDGSVRSFDEGMDLVERYCMDCHYADDPDGDLAVNLMEYAFGTDPEDATDAPAALKFTNSAEGQNAYTLEYRRDYEPADIIFDLYKTDDLTTPFSKATNGPDYRQFGRTLDADGMETIELNIESNTEKHFFKIQAEHYTE